MTQTPDAVEVFLEAMSSLAAGVVVVTGKDSDGTPRGFTATSVTSYSANPPSVIVCIDETSNSYRAVVEGDFFGVSLLAAGQQDIARLFASKAGDKFDQCRWWWSEEGIPLLEGAVFGLDCRRAFVARHGDHAMVIGEVVAGVIEDRPPLVYYRRSMFDGLA